MGRGLLKAALLRAGNSAFDPGAGSFQVGMLGRLAHGHGLSLQGLPQIGASYFQARLEIQGLLEMGNGFLQPLLPKANQSQVVPAFSVPRLIAQQLLKASRRVFQFALLAKHGPEPIDCGQKMGNLRQGLPQVILGLVEPALGLVHGPKKTTGIHVPRIAFQDLSIEALGFRKLAGLVMLPGAIELRGIGHEKLLRA